MDTPRYVITASIALSAKSSLKRAVRWRNYSHASTFWRDNWTKPWKKGLKTNA
jgi:hypothetical protein